MRRTVVVVALLSGMVVAAWPAGSQRGEIEKTIADLENKWSEAQKIANADAVAPMLAESFVNTDAEGQTYGRDRLLFNLKGARWELNGISDVKVTVYGTTAIATGAWMGKGVDGDGSKIDRRERWTDTWVKIANAKWLCVASQQTAVPQL
ncbi:MAG: nuclear transport factor 2 family protein [Acidobacteriia bacterium]|nr:nuclear transport factor 2 family protein [Terriglobia bacterium]